MLCNMLMITCCRSREKQRAETARASDMECAEVNVGHGKGIALCYRRSSRSMNSILSLVEVLINYDLQRRSYQYRFPWSRSFPPLISYRMFAITLGHVRLAVYSLTSYSVLHCGKNIVHIPSVHLFPDLPLPPLHNVGHTSAGGASCRE